MTTHRQAAGLKGIAKSPTGIEGLDDITEGGFPRGRTTMVAGSAGCGKTLLAAEFLLRGATRFGEPGVFMCFEENEDELAKNVASLGFDLKALIRRGALVVDYVHIERSEIEETGEYDLEGLFVRLAHAIDTVKAKRVVLDTLEALFAAIPNEAILRAELRRLFRWLKEKGVTALITAERGRDQLSRHGLEEYVSDCVVVLDHRVNQGISTRHLRIVKYRGSKHGTNEYPFLIDNDGLYVLPITALKLEHGVSSQRISTGIRRLDEMVGGKGFYRGSSVLVTGMPGTGKTSVAASFALAACRRGERVLYFAFEESPSQIVRNMRSIGLDLEPQVARGRLKFHASRPTLYGLEMHLSTMIKEVARFKPSVVIVDPLTSLTAVGSELETKSMATRLVDHLKGEEITSMFTSLVHAGNREANLSEMAISSLMDTWLQFVDIIGDGEHNRGLYVIKSRGMSHSNQIREVVITGRGMNLVDTYVGPNGMLTGAARAAQAAQEKAAAEAQQEEVARLKAESDRRRSALERQIADLQAQQTSEKEQMRRLAQRATARLRAAAGNRAEMARLRYEIHGIGKASGNGPETGRTE